MQQNGWKTLPKARLGLAVLAGLSITLLDPSLVKAATPITQADIPFTIDQAGQYIVTENLSGAANQTTITIQADHVHLNLNGFTLSGPIDNANDCFKGETSVGIDVVGAPDDPLVGVHINGGAVHGFGASIKLADTNANHLNGLTVTGNCSCGVQLLNSNNNHINSNNISDNFGAGVCLANSDKNKFNTNKVNNNVRVTFAVGFGYSLSASDGNIITSNDISGNGGDIGGDGVLLAGANNNTIRDNTANGNSEAGVQMLSSNNNTIRNNTTNGNGVFGIRLIFFNTGNLIQGNTANGKIAGILLDVGATGNTVKSNTALGNITDLADFNFGSRCPNIWKNNAFVTEDGNVGCIR